jgi:hypothetical protein
MIKYIFLSHHDLQNLMNEFGHFIHELINILEKLLIRGIKKYYYSFKLNIMHDLQLISQKTFEDIKIIDEE